MGTGATKYKEVGLGHPIQLQRHSWLVYGRSPEEVTKNTARNKFALIWDGVITSPYEERPEPRHAGRDPVHDRADGPGERARGQQVRHLENLGRLMGEVDLGALLGLDRETMRLNGDQWEVRAPGELTFADSVRFQELSNRLANGAVEASEAEKVRDELRGLLIAKGDAAKLPDAGLEVAMRLFTPALLAMRKRMEAVGASKAKAGSASATSRST